MTFPGMPADLNNLLSYFINNTNLSGTSGSDDLNRAWIAAQAQRYSAILPSYVNMLAQNQANQVRWAELMGTSGDRDAAGNYIPTDAAARWRAELAAQQAIQGGRLGLDTTLALGYQVRPDGSLDFSRPTMQGQQLQNEINQANLNRAQQTAMEQLQQQGRLALQQGQQGWTTGERLGTQGFQTQERLGQQGFQTQERLGTQQFQAGESAAERALRLQMQQAELGSTAQQNELERQLRRDLQSGQLSQQESEFARTYILQQEQSRRQQAELGGYLVDAQGNSTGQLTEAARAAREQERTQRAALAAQLMQSPKDVFRAGAYFRNMAGADPYGMGLTGGGISGFNSLAQRAGGTPGSATLADVESMPGMGGSIGNTGTPQEQMFALAAGPQAQAQAVTGTPEQAATTGGVTAGQTVGSSGTDTTDDDVPGMQPGGPVGSGRRRRTARAQTPGAELQSLLGGGQADSQQPSSDAMARWVDLLSKRFGRQQPQQGASKQAKSDGQQSAQDQIKATEDLIQAQNSALQAQNTALQAQQAPSIPNANAATLMPGVPAAQVPATAPSPAPGDQLAALLGGEAGRWRDALAAQSQTQGDALNQAYQLANNERVASLLTGANTDAATRWHQELAGQQAAQQSNTGTDLTASSPGSLSALGGGSTAGGSGGAGFGMGGGGSGSSTSSGSGTTSPSTLGGSSGGGTDWRSALQQSQAQSSANLKQFQDLMGGGGTPGMSPGGPVGDSLAALLPRNRRNGMGAGGNFPGRAAPDGSVPGVVPYVDPSVLMDPDVRAMISDVRKQGVAEDARRRNGKRGASSGPSGPAGPQGQALLYDADEADRRRWADERFLHGLAGLNRRGVLGRPGTGPAGPVDAPLWPENGSGTNMPEVQTPQSVGDGSSFNLGAANAGTQAATGLTGMDPNNQQAAMNYLSDFLINGVGNQDPQFLQRMSKTQRGIAEGALQAAGLNWDDFVEAAAQTRFQNVGNVLSA